MSLLSVALALVSILGEVSAQGIVANAPYNLKLSSSNNCLTAASNANNAPVFITPCTNAATQQWFFSAGSGRQGTSAKQTLTIFGNKCLDVTGGKNVNGNKMQIYTCNNGNTNQQWVVDSTLNSSSVQWAGKGKCLDNTGGSTTSGNPTQIWNCGSGNPNQQWVPEFAGNILPAGTPMQLSFGDGGGGCISAQDKNNSVVTFTACSDNIHTNTWIYTGGSLKVFGNMCLDVPNGKDQDGLILQVYQCFAGNKNQQWILNPDTSIQWKGHNKCVDLTNGDASGFNIMSMTVCDPPDINQEWKELPVFSQ